MVVINSESVSGAVKREDTFLLDCKMENEDRRDSGETREMEGGERGQRVDELDRSTHVVEAPKMPSGGAPAPDVAALQEQIAMWQRKSAENQEQIAMLQGENAKVKRENQEQIAMLQGENAMLQGENASVKRDYASVKRENADLKQEKEEFTTHHPSFRELKKRKMTIPNETASTAHTDTGHHPAKYDRMEIPDYTLPETLLNFRPMFRGMTSHDSEPSVSASVNALVREIIYGLKFEHIVDSQLEVPMMDTVPDVILKVIRNKLLAGTVEVKKDPKSASEREKIFGSDTEVAGEVFEQLFLAQANLLGEKSVGLLTTYNSWQLVSTEELTRSTDLEQQKTLDFFSKKKHNAEEPTPDRPQVAVRPREQVKGEGEGLAESFKIKATAKPTELPQEFSKEARNRVRKKQGKKPLKDPKPYKFGRVAERAREAEVERRYFASEVVDLGSEGGNEKVFKLIAVYVLLVLKCFRKFTESDEDIASTTKFRARVLHQTGKIFALTEIELIRPIDFHSNFHFLDTHKFYALKQLGYGSYGVCCLSINQDLVACVLKFLHRKAFKPDESPPVVPDAHGVASDKDDALDSAKREAKRWKDIYELSAGVLKIHERVVIAMPYLEIPSNYADRVRLVEGGENSPLYRGLLYFCNRGFTHDEVLWHHIGVPVGCPKFANLCLLCDLGDGRIRGHKFTESEKSHWVQTRFDELRGRMGQGEAGATSKLASS